STKRFDQSEQAGHEGDRNEEVTPAGGEDQFALAASPGKLGRQPGAAVCAEETGDRTSQTAKHATGRNAAGPLPRCCPRTCACPARRVFGLAASTVRPAMTAVVNRCPGRLRRRADSTR